MREDGWRGRRGDQVTQNQVQPLTNQKQKAKHVLFNLQFFDSFERIVFVAESVVSYLIGKCWSLRGCAKRYVLGGFKQIFKVFFFIYDMIYF